MKSASGKNYTMRSIRCYWATKWVKTCAECRVLRTLEPPNPLQHEKDSKTVLKHYAELGSDSEFEARKRCWEKYPERMEELYGALNE